MFRPLPPFAPYEVGRLHIVGIKNKRDDQQIVSLYYLKNYNLFSLLLIYMVVMQKQLI